MENEELIPWTDEERTNARLALGDLVDQLLGLGVEEAEIKEIIRHQKSLIGNEEISYKTWENRFVAMSYRVVNKVTAKGQTR